MDQAVLQDLGNNTLATNGTALKQAAIAAGTASVCTEDMNSWAVFFNSSCWPALISAVISGALVSVASWVLTVAGILFNWSPTETVLQFGQLINSNIITGINTAWSAFRDISNIVIIGMFTFIAIATILGIDSYGYKKLLARVLIVAILNNFCLLFTKLVIDVSNFTATQFASAAGGPLSQLASATSTSSTVNSSSPSQWSQPAGVAGAFMQYAGVTGFGDTSKAVFELGKNPQGGGAWLGLLYGVVTALLFLIAAIVLFYGTFLLVTRALLMIFLMITSAIAFATYLIPSLSSGGYGFNGWLQALLKNAIFAPLLMVLLWVTLQIGQAFSVTTGSLGQLITSPEAAINVNALFGYIIVIGLLFVSLKIASSFSTQIGGFNYASMVPAIGVAASSRVAGLFGRQTVGRAASAIGANFQKKSQDENRSMFMRNLYDFGAQRAKGVAKKDFNAMRTPLGNALKQATGVKKIDSLAGKKVGGFQGGQEAVAKKVAEKAQRMTASAEDQAKVVKAAIEKEIQNDPELARQHKQATDVHESAQADQKTEEGRLTEIHNQHAEEMKQIHSELERASSAASAGEAGAEAQVTASQQRLAEARRRQTEQLDEQTQRIERARGITSSTYNQIQRIEDAARDRAVAIGKLPRDLTVDNRGKITGFKNAGDTARDIIQSKFTRAFFTDTENKRLESMAVHEVGTQGRKKKLKESGLIDAFREQVGGGHAPVPHAAAHVPEAPAPDHAAEPEQDAEH